MNTEQQGPPSDEQRTQRDMEFVRISQFRFCEGYHARMSKPHPMRKNARGEQLNTREPRWSYAECASGECPGKTVRHLVEAGPIRYGESSSVAWPAHERERWIAGYLHADGIAKERGVAAMERADPSRPPPRPRRVAVAVQEDGLSELAPPLNRAEAKEWWERHRGISSGFKHRDAGEQ